MVRLVRLLVIVFDVVCGNVFDTDFFDDVVLNVDVSTVLFANNLSSFLFCTASFCSSFSFLFLSLSLIFLTFFPPQVVSSSPPFLVILSKIVDW